MKLNRPLLVIILVFILAISLRLPFVGQTMAADERNWMLRSQTFWHELFRRGDLSGTFLSSHPGATVMWLAGAGITWQENSLGFDLNRENTLHFRRYATAPIALMTAALIALTTYLIFRLLGLKTAFLSGSLLAIDPYLVGIHQTIHPDALLGLFMLAALLGALLWNKKRQRRWLIFTGCLSGLAFVTKLLPALWLVPVIGLIIAWPLRKNFQLWPQSLGRLGLVALFVAMTFAIVWPATLTQPDFQLGYLSRDATAVATQEHVALSASEKEGINPLTFYIRTWLGRLTPVTQLLILGTFLATFLTWWRTRRLATRPAIIWLFVFSFSYLIFITFAAKKADRYALPALTVFVALAGWALSQGADSLVKRLGWSLKPKAFLLGAVLLAVLASTVSWGKYTLAYNNSFFPGVRPPSQQGWGEGIEAAAKWINEQPGVDENTVVAAWYPSVFGTYFNGKTVHLEARFSHKPAYILTYRNMAGRAKDTTASEVLFELEGAQPLHTVLIKGEPYAQVWAGETVQP